MTLPHDMIVVLSSFAPLFSTRVFPHVQRLVAGALLTPGRRTVTAILRVMGYSERPHFQTYHRVLNRDRWSSRKVSEVLKRSNVGEESGSPPKGSIAIRCAPARATSSNPVDCGGS
jgi:hypothetical protein